MFLHLDTVPSLTENRYYPSLLSSKYNDDGEPFLSADLVTSSDTILTALAQLGTCQTGTARALISLFDHKSQFIIAEATPNLPLVPSLDHNGRDGEDLWLCGTAIPRAHGACGYTLSYRDRKNPNDSKLPLVLVDDLQADERFKSLPYCRPGCPAKFYAAVPIRTRRGINIGTFCVFSPQPVEWDYRKADVMRNLSRTIMERLEATKSKTLNRRAERMNRGLGSFVEGRATVTGWQLGPNTAAFKDNIKYEGALNAKQQLLHQQEETLATSRIGQLGEETFPFPVMVPVSVEGHPGLTGHPDRTDRRLSISSTIKEPTIHDVFSKAANIVRESLEIEGCLFLDAAVGSFSPPGNDAPENSKSRRDSRSEASEGSDGEARYSSCDGAQGSQTSCQVLGFSTTDVSSIDGGLNSARHGAMQEKFLLGLLRRYPKGRIFSFDDEGELQSSDSSEGASSGGSQPATSPTTAPNQAAAFDALSPMSNASVPTPGGKHRVRPAGMGNEGTQLLQVFPGARSVAFVPVWDSRKERWCAGGFIYTHTPTRVFTTEGELSYMRAFGMLAMAETLWCETRLSEKAKTDALSSLSHEIRSPLRALYASSAARNFPVPSSCSFLEASPGAVLASSGFQPRSILPGHSRSHILNWALQLLICHLYKSSLANSMCRWYCTRS